MSLRVSRIVQRLLADSPGEALCDACLAFACDTSLAEMRQLTQALVADESSIVLGTRCASCRRTVAAVFFADPASKCAHCSRPFNDGESAVLLEGDRFHDACLRRLLTDDTIRVSRRLNARSRELIEQSLRRIRDGQGRMDPGAPDTDRTSAADSTE